MYSSEHLPGWAGGLPPNKLGSPGIHINYTAGRQQPGGGLATVFTCYNFRDMEGERNFTIGSHDYAAKREQLVQNNY